MTPADKLLKAVKPDELRTSQVQTAREQLEAAKRQLEKLDGGVK